MIKSIKINIYGRVQGVGFRYSTLQKANELRITGFVKNRSDGSVYIEADGEPETLDKFILWCRQGPSGAVVDEVKTADITYNNYSKFTIK